MAKQQDTPRHLHPFKGQPTDKLGDEPPRPTPSNTTWFDDLAVQVVNVVYPKAPATGPTGLQALDKDGVPFTNIFEIEASFGRNGMLVYVFTGKEHDEFGMNYESLMKHPLEAIGDGDPTVLVSIGGGDPIFGCIVPRRISKYSK